MARTRYKKAVILQRQKKGMKKIGLIASLGLLLLYYWRSRKSTAEDDGDSLNYFDDIEIDVHNNAIPDGIEIIPAINVKSVNKTKNRCICKGHIALKNTGTADVYIFGVEGTFRLFGKLIGYNKISEIPRVADTAGNWVAKVGYTKGFDFGGYWGRCDDLSKTDLSQLQAALDQYQPNGGKKYSFAKSGVHIIWGYSKDDYKNNRAKRWTIQNLDSIVTKWTE